MMHSGLWHIGMGIEVPVGIVIWRSTSLLPWLMVLKAPHVEEFVQSPRNLALTIEKPFVKVWRRATQECLFIVLQRFLA